MSSNSDQNDRWQVEALRLSAFPAPTAAMSDKERERWWVDFVGTPSDETTIKRGERIEKGPWHAGSLVLQSGPSRIDWRYNHALSPEDTETPPRFESLLLGPFPDAARDFFDLVRRWLRECPQLERVAVGGVLILAATSRQDGYKKLRPYLKGVAIDPDNSTDFLYQINRPRTSTAVPGIRFNRLSKWSVMQWKLLAMRIGSEDSKIVPSVESPFDGCRLEFDVNSVPEQDLPKSKLPDLFDEFSANSIEISQMGDIP